MAGDYLFPDVRSITSAQQMSVILEVSGEPKPGNVGRNKAFREISYDDFLFATASVTEPLSFAYESARSALESGNAPGGLWGGALLESSRRAMAGRSNTIFGSLLIEIPIGLGASLAHRRGAVLEEAALIVDASDTEDSLAFVEAVWLSGVGGLTHPAFVKSPDALDLNDPEILRKIRENEIGLRDLLCPSAGYDLLASEILNGFPIVREKSSQFVGWLRDLGDPLKASAAVYTSLLSSLPDSLIARKVGIEVAQEVRSKAERAMEAGMFSEDWHKAMDALDEFLRSRDLNPGTLADLTAASIFLALLGEAPSAFASEDP